jgi:hypothetical protein
VSSESTQTTVQVPNDIPVDLPPTLTSSLAQRPKKLQQTTTATLPSISHTLKRQHRRDGASGWIILQPAEEVQVNPPVPFYNPPAI